MPYITREDGERFIIPSYRDTISANKDSLLKKEVMLLSTNYGEYVAIQKKSETNYEVAFSSDAGYLLGECVWSHFKQPSDMIYCEEIPNTTEAILVIVKSGSVYLDGSFQIDSIPEELVIFKTQQNNFNIYIYGNVPISEHPEEGKFSFDFNAVKSFEELSEPVFPTLPTVKAFQLQLLDVALKNLGIGVVPIKPVILGIAGIFLAYMAGNFVYTYISTHHAEIPASFVMPVNPYQGYLDQLSSADPARQVHDLVQSIAQLFSIPGWEVGTLEYTPGKLRASVTSVGGSVAALIAWSNTQDVKLEILPDGMYVNLTVTASKRTPPQTINSMQGVLSTLIDSMTVIQPNTPIVIGVINDKKAFLETNITIPFANASLMTLDIIGTNLQGLPLVLNKLSAHIQDGEISGTLILKALGN